jgi:hypothetical protein
VSRKLYIHKRGIPEPELIEVEESITVEELIVRHGNEGDRAWARDGDELIVTEIVVDIVEERSHIHVGPHAKIDVTVRYETGDKSKEYKPGTKVQTVLDWARGDDGFNVPPNQRGELGLFLPDSKEPLDPDEVIGVFAEHDHLRLTLAPIKRPQG